MAELPLFPWQSRLARILNYSLAGRLSWRCPASLYILSCVVPGTNCWSWLHLTCSSLRKSWELRLPWDKISRWGPFHLDGLDKVHCELSFYPLRFEFSLYGLAKWGWVNSSFVCLVELDLVLHCFNQNKESSAHALKMCELTNKFVGMC